MRRKKREEALLARVCERVERVSGKERERRHERKKVVVRGEREGERAQGSSERERQLAAFSRDDAPSRPRLGFPRGGKTRLVSLSLITILCVVVDDEGRRRASDPGYRQQESRGSLRACLCAVRARAHARTSESLGEPPFF